MLEAMRKHSTSLVVKLLFVLLILSFALWGVGDFVRKGGSDGTIMTVGEVKISAREVQTEFNRELSRMRQFFGGKLSAEDAKKFGLVELTLDRVRNRVLMDLAARDLGIAVSDAQVSQAILSAPSFYDEKGRFDRRLYEQVLISNNLSEDEFVRMMRRDLARSRLTVSVGEGAVPSRTMAEILYRHRNEKRSAELMVIGISDAGAAPSADTLAEFHQKNAARYTAPEYRALSYVLLDAESLAGKAKPGEAQIEEAYQQRKDEFAVPERRKLVQLRLASEEEAKKAGDMVKEGKSLAEAAKALGGKPLDEMGLVEKAELPAEARDAVFALAQGAVSPPLKSAFGWHLFKIEGIEAAGAKSPAEAKAQIAIELTSELAGKIVYETSNKLEDALAGGANLAEAAKNIGLTLHKAEAVDARGNNPAGAKVENLPKNERFLKSAFGTAEGAESSLIETETGYFMLRVEKITPPVLRPLETVKERVAADWKIEESRKLAEKKAQEVLAALKESGDLLAVAGRFKLDVVVTEAFRREGRPDDEALTPAMVAELFKLKPGEATMGEAPRGFTVARLKAITPADPAADQAGLKNVSDELAEIVSGDLVDSFTAALAVRYGVKVNQKIISELGN